MSSKLLLTVCSAWISVMPTLAEGVTPAEKKAMDILESTGVKGGLVVHVGCGETSNNSIQPGELTAALRAGDNYLVHGLDTKADAVGKAREHIRDRGLYGSVSVAQFNGKHLPYTNNIVNLLVVDSPIRIPQSEINRVLAPGGVQWINGTKKFKPRPADIDDWPQYLHGADNNAVSRDTTVGPPRHLQWKAAPLWSRSHMGIPSINSMITTNGRLFTIEDAATVENPFLPGKFQLVARDAFNGIVLWKHRIPEWEPVTRYVKDIAVQIQKRMAAVGDVLYFAAGLSAPITQFDAATGEAVKVYENTNPTRELAYCDGIIYAVVGDSDNAARYNIVKPEKWRGKNLGGADPRAPFGGTGFRGRYAPETANKERTVCVIKAIEASTGKELWHTKEITDYTAASLSIRGDSAVFQTRAGLVCVNSKTGVERWEVKEDMQGGDGTEPNVVVITDTMVYAQSAGKELTAYSLADGAKQWDGRAPRNYEKAGDVFVVGDIVWVGGKGVPTGYDARTGKVVRRLKQKETRPMGHDRCYRNFITRKYYINSKTGGADFLKLDNSGEFPNYWTRGTCGMGVLPANGLLYVPPFSCQCNMGVMVNGFNALYTEPDLKKSDQPIKVERTVRLIKGPACAGTYPRTEATADKPAQASTTDPSDWPTYRHDFARSGNSTTVVPAKLKRSWKFDVTTRPSAPVIADGRVFVSDVDAHTLYALDAASGKKLWSFIAGGRIDSPPTYYKGRILFGSRDGWVYCLRADDGVPAWKFKDLPDKLISAFGQLESAWPVHGSVLIKKAPSTPGSSAATVYFCAGRNSFLDGGIFVYGLNPLTGEIIHRAHQYGPFRGKNGFPHHQRGFKSDIMVADKARLYIRHKAYKPDLSEVDRAGPHILPAAGFTDRVPQHRTYWAYFTGGMFRGSMKTQVRAPHGDIMVTDDNMHYEVRGFPVHRHSYFDPRKSGYKLAAGTFSNKRVWAVDIPITGNAMIKAGDKVFVAGKKVQFPVDMFEKTRAGYEGKSGAVLLAVSAEDGSRLATYKFDSPVGWDGMAVANNRLYLSMKNGEIICLGK